jgi:hypothetical protein
VSAGGDLILPSLGVAATLTGTASDDGVPVVPGQLSLQWSARSGPGTVTFGNPNTASTTARFSAPGTYVLRLTADDGATRGFDELTVTVLGLDVGLAGHWRFDEGSGTVAADASGGNNEATLRSGAQWADGRFGKALSVPGTNDRATVPDPADDRLDFGTGDFTVAIWMKSGSAFPTTRFPTLLVKTLYIGDTNRVGYEIFGYNTGSERVMVFRTWSGPGTGTPGVGGLFDDKWHHLVGRKTSGQIELFVDGVRRASRPHGVGSLSNAEALHFGSKNGEAYSNYDGLLDDARIYSRALSDQEAARPRRFLSSHHSASNDTLKPLLERWLLGRGAKRGLVFPPSGHGEFIQAPASGTPWGRRSRRSARSARSAYPP